MKARVIREPKGKRYMSDAAFEELEGSLKEALAHARGGRADLRVAKE